jgi:hypothetical protein
VHKDTLTRRQIVRSLSAHLRQPEDHARLEFRPDCPICRRERLVGVLPAEGLVSRRGQAVIAAGILAVSAAAPPVVLAAEQEQSTEGVGVPQQEPGGDAAGSPGFDPGGESTDLPFEAPPTPQVPAPPALDDDDAAALEGDPPTDADAPIADPGDEQSPSSLETGPVDGPPAVPEMPGPLEAPSASEVPTAPPPAALPEEPQAARERARAEGKSPEREQETPPPEAVDAPPEPASPPHIANPPSSSPPSIAHPPSPPTPRSTAPDADVDVPPRVSTGEPVRAAPRAATLAVAGARDQARPGDRYHVVRAGESLWSIASDLLGEQATVARIAREVNHLWTLNADRIATGDPDLLMIGTRLRL